MTRSRIASFRPILVGCVFFGCGDRDERLEQQSTGVSSTTGVSTSGASGNDETAGVWDVGASGGMGPGGEGGPATGCSKVDFLFVIDSSGSMEGEQTNLINSFPGFIDAILAKTNAKDFRILVTDTDAMVNGQICATLCTLLPDCLGTPCNQIPPPGMASPCDSTLGAGHIADQNNAPCGVQGNQRYLLESQPNLAATFACIARVGTLGDGNEQQAGATVAAVGPMINGPGGCNDGFLRSDAILVVTIITDEEDGPDGADDDMSSPGTPAEWKQAIVNAKLGDEQAIVMLGLVGDSDVANGICQPLDPNNNVGAEPAPNLRTFIQSFPRNAWSSVCAPNYAPFFEQAISIIDTACDEYVPPG